MDFVRISDVSEAFLRPERDSLEDDGYLFCRRGMCVGEREARQGSYVVSCSLFIKEFVVDMAASN